MNKETQAVSNDMGEIAEDARALMAATADVTGEKVGEARKSQSSSPTPATVFLRGCVNMVASMDLCWHRGTTPNHPGAETGPVNKQKNTPSHP